MRYGNIDLILDWLEKLDAESVDKDLLKNMLKKCETDPFRDLLIRIIKETK